MVVETLAVMEALFSVKKVLGAFLSPLPLSILLLAICAILLFASETQRKKFKVSFIFGFGLLLVASLPFTSFYLLRPLETAYPKYEDQLDKVDNIVVLGCYNSNDKQLPAIANIHPCSMYRIIEALRLSRVYPQSQLYLTGWESKDAQQLSHPEYLAKVMIRLGLDSERLTTIVGSKDTEDEVRALAPYLKNKVNLVVSSASHFTRAMRLFDEFQLDITPVPAEYLTHKDGIWSWRLFLPDPDALQVSQRAVYEYLGNIWVRLKSSFTQEEMDYESSE